MGIKLGYKGFKELISEGIFEKFAKLWILVMHKISENVNSKAFLGQEPQN